LDPRQAKNRRHPFANQRPYQSLAAGEPFGFHPPQRSPPHLSPTSDPPRLAVSLSRCLAVSFLPCRPLSPSPIFLRLAKGSPSPSLPVPRARVRVSISPRLHFTPSPFHPVAISPGRPVAPSPCRPVTRHSPALSPRLPVAPFPLEMALSPCHPSPCRPVAQS